MKKDEAPNVSQGPQSFAAAPHAQPQLETGTRWRHTKHSADLGSQTMTWEINLWNGINFIPSIMHDIISFMCKWTMVFEIDHQQSLEHKLQSREIPSNSRGNQKLLTHAYPSTYMPNYIHAKLLAWNDPRPDIFFWQLTEIETYRLAFYLTKTVTFYLAFLLTFSVAQNLAFHRTLCFLDFIQQKFMAWHPATETAIGTGRDTPGKETAIGPRHDTLGLEPSRAWCSGTVGRG